MDSGLTPAFNWENGFPRAFPTSFPVLDPALQNDTALRLIDRSENQPAYSQNLSFEIGREMAHGISLRAAYVGNLSRRMVTRNGAGVNGMPLQFLSMGDLLNADIDSQAALDAGIPKPYPSYTGSVAQALRPYPQFQDIVVWGAQFGSANYHALQMNFQKRTGDLAFLIAYTASKQIANTDYPGWTGQGSVIRQHPNVLHLSREVLRKDRPKILNISWAYDLPFGTGKKYMSGVSRAANFLVGGWTLSAIQNYMGGNPIRVSSTQTIPGGFGGIWAQRAGGSVEGVGCGSYSPGDRFLNAGAFSTAAPFSLGDTSQLPSTRDCAVIQENIMLEKNFQITERIGVEFGTIWQNALNRHWWIGLQTGIESADFGKYTGSSPPRNIMFYLTLKF